MDTIAVWVMSALAFILLILLIFVFGRMRKQLLVQSEDLFEQPHGEAPAVKWNDPGEIGNGRLVVIADGYWARPPR